MTAEGREGNGTMTADSTMTAETTMGTTTEDKTVISEMFVICVFHHGSLTGIRSCLEDAKRDGGEDRGGYY